MTVIAPRKKVEIANQAFANANAMRDCPAKNVIREILQNAIEAPGTTHIEWGRFDWHGVAKLSLYNEGAGMTLVEMDQRLCYTAPNRPDKPLGFDKNFGQGARMAGLKASPHGLVYRSCKGGVVHELWLQIEAQPDGVPAMTVVPRSDPDSEDHELVNILDVTDDAAERGRPLSCDWTEVVLLGRHDADNTLDGAFLGQHSKLWLMQSINQRFYRFPAGVVVRQATITSQRGGNHRNARGLAEIMLDSAASDRYEAVPYNHPRLGPLTILYGKLTRAPKDRQGGPLAAEGIPGGTHLGVVWRDEVYDLELKWAMKSGAYGFHGASNDYFIQVILSDDAPVLADGHRTRVYLRGGDPTDDAVTCESLCNAIRDNRPVWVLEDLRARQEVCQSGKLEEFIRRLAEQLRVCQERPVVAPPGDDEGVVLVGPPPGDGEGGPGGTSGRVPPLNGSARAVRKRGKATERPRPETLKVVFQSHDNKAWYDEMEGRAGAYDKAVNTLYLSHDFVEYCRLKDWVDAEWPDRGDQGLENGSANKLLVEEYCKYAAVYAVSALSFRSSPHWAPDYWEKALTPEALSAYLRDPTRVIQAGVRREVNSRLNPRIRDLAGEASRA